MKEEKVDHEITTIQAGSGGGRFFDEIIVDTSKLYDYGLRINTVNSCLGDLDKRLNSLYMKVGVLGLLELVQADIMTVYGVRLSSCGQTVIEISQDFEKAEKVCATTDWLSDSFKYNSISTELLNPYDIDSVMHYIDATYENQPEAYKMLLKESAKKLFGSNAVKGYELLNELREGDYWNAVWKGYDIITSGEKDFFLKLKFKAVSETIKLVSDQEGYIQKNDDKYMDIMVDRWKDGDVIGTVWNMGGSLVQTAGKGTVDVTCRLISGALDSVTEKTFGISVSNFNAVLEREIGVSPGSVFNDVATAVGDGVDAFIDTGTEVLKNTHNTAKKISSGIYGVVTDTVDNISNFFDKLF